MSDSAHAPMFLVAFVNFWSDWHDCFGTIYDISKHHLPLSPVIKFDKQLYYIQ